MLLLYLLSFKFRSAFLADRSNGSTSRFATVGHPSSFWALIISGDRELLSATLTFERDLDKSR